MRSYRMILALFMLTASAMVSLTNRVVIAQDPYEDVCFCNGAGTNVDAKVYAYSNSPAPYTYVDQTNWNSGRIIDTPSAAYFCIQTCFYEALNKGGALCQANNLSSADWFELGEVEYDYRDSDNSWGGSEAGMLETSPYYHWPCPS
jgi:hypothetical protein